MSAAQGYKGVTKEAVLKILHREADLEGVIIFSIAAIGRELGISPSAAAYHVDVLRKEGLLKMENPMVNHQLRKITLLTEEYQ